MTSRYRIGLVLACVLALAASASAELKLPSVIGPNMVLQTDQPVPIWGWEQVDASGADITVTFAGQSKTAKTDANGKWMIKLDAMKPSATGRTLTVQSSIGKGKLELANVLVGEVWICSGQSNMGWTVKGSNNAAAEIAAAKYPNIRLFSVPHTTAATPQSNCGGSWAPCSPANAGNFTAVGYFFGRQIHKDLKVPVGLINTSWGGTRVEAWTSGPALAKTPEAGELLQSWKTQVANFDSAKAQVAYTKALAAHKVKLAAEKKRLVDAKKAGKPVTPRRLRAPRKPVSPAASQHHPSVLYNAMIAPLVPFACQGGIWYQGESNASRGYQYRTLFPLMIKDWRQAWGREMPFAWVQLANFRTRNTEPVEDDWAELREAQSMTLALPKTAEAVIIDIGEAKNIHPKNKQDVGKRLALGALKVAYGQDIVHSGPRLASMKISGKTAVLTFDCVGGGLVAKGEGKLVGFAIAGADKKFVWADAKIVGKTVVVSCEGVARPVAVRYAWSANPACNLYNAEDLPASPFRTDTWDGITKGKNTP